MTKSTATCTVVLFLLLTNLLSAQTSALSSISMIPEKSIIESAAASENLKTLMAIIRAADLEDILSNDGPFTVFAPSDTAFQKFSKEKMAHLFHPANKKELFALLTYHIVAGNFTGAKILKALSQGEGEASFTTIQGTEIKATLRGIDIILTDHLGNSAAITTADAAQCNGVIHEIDGVIVPKSGNFLP
ncbi:fasciclin domain-containing protein [Arenibacter sp. GZD96]|uniref:fasciclin domain-containing protein n=1 Tax=Aurantibrevibacter litoralis TaxID=3106030 RepID=UPI002AFFBEB6|nr:fasciclin domain-containing protein [Arenibacter sp. GZD-96]MEA1787373.1 fasciclin domain-containing protein [Arenibacter sp. GZD-96]